MCLSLMYMQFKMKNIGLSTYDIKDAYCGVKYKANQAFQNGQYEECLQLIRHCATIAQQFNWIYTDDELENLLKDISIKIITTSSEPYIPVKNRVVLYDDFCRSFILALQYIDALLAAGKEVIYITIKHQTSNFSTILSLLEEKYPTVKIIALQHTSRVQNNLDLYNFKFLLFHLYKTHNLYDILRSNVVFQPSSK